MTTIITHNGRFHANEVMACAMIDLITSDDVEIVRTRDLDWINQYDENSSYYVVGVGAVYDVSKQRFDQKLFRDFYNSYYAKIGIPLSSCGLIYKYYGRKLVKTIWHDYVNMYCQYSDVKVEVNYEIDNWIVDSIYNRHIAEFDAHDNGIWTDRFIKDTKIKVNYNNSLIAMISSFNATNHNNHQAQNVNFSSAVDLAKSYLVSMIKTLLLCIANKIKVRTSIEAAFDQHRHKVKSLASGDPQRHILILPKGGKTIYTYLHEFDPKKQILLIIDTSKSFRLRTISGRCNLISQSEAKQLIGDNLVFIHKAGFIGETQTLTSAIKVATASIEHHLAQQRCKRLLRTIKWTSVGLGLVIMTSLGLKYTKK